MIDLKPRDQNTWGRDQYSMRQRLRPRPIIVRPRPKKWSRNHLGLKTLTCLVLARLSLKTLLIHFAHISPNFYRNEKPEIWPWLKSPWRAFDALCSGNEATYWKSKQSFGATIIGLCPLQISLSSVQSSPRNCVNKFPFLENWRNRFAKPLISQPFIYTYVLKCDTLVCVIGPESVA